MRFCLLKKIIFTIFCGMIINTGCVVTSVFSQTEMPSGQTEEVLRKVNSNIKQIHEDNILLKKVIKQINTPLSGVEEIIRQEKMRMLITRLNRNIQRIEELRKEQEAQMKMVEDQRRIIDQQKNLPS